MNWDRDRRFDTARRGPGESYRPGDRNGRRSPREDFRSMRSPPRSRTPPRLAADTWAPSSRGRPRSRSPDSFRRRSRTPPFRPRDSDAGYGGRPRSPPRRMSPARDGRRSPPRGPRRSRSPRFARERSPPKRSREQSPAPSYYSRSPKRERLASPPRGRFERRRTPPRQEFSRDGYSRGDIYPPSQNSLRREGEGESYGERSWRRRSPSPAPGRSGRNSVYGSTSTSRRSSPPTQFNDRLNVPPSGPATRSPSYSSGRPQYDSAPTRSPRPGSPSRVLDAVRPSSPPKGPAHHGPSPRTSEPPSGPKLDRDRGQFDSHSIPTRPRSPSSRYSQNNAQTTGAPPTQPKGQSASPPTGPAAAPRAPSGQSRVGSTSLLSAPTRPRGTPGGVPGPTTVPPAPRSEAPRPGPSRRGPPPPHHGPPTGPRSSYSSGSPSYDSHRPPPFRQSSSTSGAYSRSHRPVNYLSSLPTVIPGGKLLPSTLDPGSEKRLSQLESDKERLMDQIAEKQKIKRASLREWDRVCRDSATGALRSELAEGHLQRMTDGDGIGGSAF